MLISLFIPRGGESLGCCQVFAPGNNDVAAPLSRMPGNKGRTSHGSALVPVTKSPSERAVPVCTQQSLFPHTFMGLAILLFQIG